MPQDETAIRTAPVKRLTLVKKNYPKDHAEILLGSLPSEIDVEISIQARRRGILGQYGDFTRKLNERGDPAAFFYEGVQFERATADIMIGQTRRKVGLFGYSNNTGVIEVTDVVKIGLDGHPTVASMFEEVKQLIADLHTTYGGG